MKENKIDIILPVYNEEENIGRVIEGIEKYVKTPHSIFLVFYSKSDPTIPIAKKIKANSKNIMLVTNKKEKGLAGQYKTGFDISNSKIVVTMMSDLSDNPKDIDKMVEKINKGYDLISAARYINKGKRLGGSRLKGFMSFFGSKTLSVLTGIPTRDSTNAFRCFKREILDNIKLESSTGYELPLEIIVKAYVMGYKIGEIPTVWNEREKGYSKFRMFNYLPHYLRWYLYLLRFKISRQF